MQILARPQRLADNRRMIVSASFRTDIPAFYGDWFIHRFKAGHARVPNPYGGPDGLVSLRDGVDGFVFWTRNIRPFLPVLRLVREAGIPFVVSHTVTGYPRALEAAVIEPDRAIESMLAVAAEFGPRAVVWRYDPIVFTSVTPDGFHRDSFARLADRLAGTIDECQISFATIYRKSARNLDVAARAHGFTWSDPPDQDKCRLAAALAALAAERGLTLSVCSQSAYNVAGTRPAACIDARRLEDVAAGWGRPRTIKARVKGNRPDCACHESRDIGQYDTCPHGCCYCYAVGSRALAKRRYHAHVSDGECLISGPGGAANTALSP
ncbi:DUF1848 domain-containing protein [Magnetospirillum moscoviense]|nr:DUF1848 domain-containing protein [Magnetospirillum moscoviense]